MTSTSGETDNGPILFFDGECNLCNNFIQFVIRRDKKRLFRFASLQSEAGKETLRQFVGTAPDSVILYWDGRHFIKSAAALRILWVLGGPWRLFYALIIIPGFIRDAVYDLVARNRYKWFGRRAECMLPTPELMSRFLQ